MRLPAQRELPMLRMMPAAVLFPQRVHCSSLGCQWSCPVRDVADAVEVLEQHLTAVHLAPREA